MKYISERLSGIHVKSIIEITDTQKLAIMRVALDEFKQEHEKRGDTSDTYVLLSEMIETLKHDNAIEVTQIK